MKLLLNTATLYKGGGVQVAASYINEFRNHPEHEYGIILSSAVAKIINPKNFPKNFTFYFIESRPANDVFSLGKKAIKKLKSFENEFKPDAVFTSGGPSYWRPKSFHVLGYNLPHYVYPESPYFNIINLKNKIKRKLKGELVKYFFKRDGDAFVVQTDDVNFRLRRLLKTEKVFTVTNTYSSVFDQTYNYEKALPRELGKFRVLLLSSYYPHKNLEILNEISIELKKRNITDIQFVVTLPEEDYLRAFNKCVHSSVLNRGPVLPIECPGLYNACDLMFLPSLLECFSASYAEAMRMDVPIVTTNLPFAETVCGNAALYYDPLNSIQALECILRIKNDTDFKEELIANGRIQLKKLLTPSLRAKRILELIQQNI